MSRWCFVLDQWLDRAEQRGIQFVGSSEIKWFRLRRSLRSPGQLADIETAAKRNDIIGESFPANSKAAPREPIAAKRKHVTHVVSSQKKDWCLVFAEQIPAL